jgi:hypothetical protein
MYTIKTRKVVNFKRPTEAAPGWEIYNAPRPLWGTRIWQGDFISGVFYAAIDPNDPEADRFRENNKNLDAVKLEFVTRASVVAEMVQYYNEKYSPERVDKIFSLHPLEDKETQKMLIDTWFNLEMNLVDG